MPNRAGNTTQHLLQLSQGTDSVAEFFVRFQTLALEAGCEQRVLRGVFLKALNKPLKDELAYRDDPPTFDALITLAI